MLILIVKILMTILTILLHKRGVHVVFKRFSRDKDFREKCSDAIPLNTPGNFVFCLIFPVESFFESNFQRCLAKLLATLSLFLLGLHYSCPQFAIAASMFHAEGRVGDIRKAEISIQPFTLYVSKFGFSLASKKL